MRVKESTVTVRFKLTISIRNKQLEIRSDSINSLLEDTDNVG